MNSSSLKTPLTDLPLVIDTKKRRLRIYKQTLALLDNPEYIQLLVNPEKKMILLCPATSFVEKLMLLSNVWDKNMSYKLTGTLLPKQKFILYHMEDAVSLTDTTHIKESL